MPTKKKRVGFIPREEVMKIIDKLSLENNLIPSKSTHLNEDNHEAFDLQTYKKFLSFLKFQEMMEKYNT